MPLQSRVSPFGDLFADNARGLLMGNRGGRLHDAQRKLTARRWASKQWICCKLDFNDRHRNVWGDGYTELFFLDEVTALAAGHRPCFECRRKEAERFAALFAAVVPCSAHSRLRGDARVGGARASAAMIDRVLHAERLAGKAKRLHRRAIDALPDGAMIARDGAAYALKGRSLLRWAPEGYAARQPRPAAIEADVLTPPAVLAVLAAGYRPLWHPSAA